MKKTAPSTPELPTASDASPSLHWPEKTETRCLRCDLSPTDRDKYGRESAELVHAITRLEDQKKASASSYKAGIDEKAARLKRISGYVTEGWEERPIKCEWRFECSGIDSATGEPIYHPEKKALVRLDTMEVIEVCDISGDERQMALPMEEQKPAEEPAASYEDDED